MLNACVQRFDVTGTVQKFLARFGQQGLRPCLEAQKRQKNLHSNCHIESLDVCMEY
jgi:hypothetical protein